MRQRRRVGTALIYAFALSLLSKVLFGAWIPPIGPEGAWFYSGLAILLISGALQEPFFTTPAHCIANAFALLLAAVTFPNEVDSPYAAPSGAVAFGRQWIMAYALALIAVGLLAVFFKDSSDATGRRVSMAASKVCGVVGSAKVVFSVAYLASVFGVYGEDPSTSWPLLLAWLVIVVIRPLEHLPSDLIASKTERSQVGKVVSIRHPGLVEVRVAPAESLSPGTTVQDNDGNLLLTLDSTKDLAGGWALLSVTGATLPSVGSALYASASSLASGDAIGPIETGSTVEVALIRAPVNAPHIREGALVEIPIRGIDTLYQVLGATIRRESAEADLQFRYVEVTARKIGSWDSAKRSFLNSPWLPAAGEVARLVPRATSSFHEDSVGCLPESDFPISLDPNHLVTHNTAILGILGVGKTYLTFELIRRLLIAGTKVIVLDITGEYANHFRSLFSKTTEDNLYATIEAAVSPHHAEVGQSVHQGGSVSEFRKVTAQVLKTFLNSEEPLMVINPEKIHVTRQDSKPFQGQAAMAPLTMVEVTRIIAEEVLGLLQSLPLAEKARVCMVLEEAHSLVPEWNSTTHSADQQASAGTAKAVLQGRKYGLGVLLITQRTANVTKTILNQCHTIFAMRSFDATGMEFLRNYIGASYVEALGTLDERHAVIFGRASSCPSPVIVQINDHARMLEGFWEKAKDSIEVESLGIP